MEDDGELGVDDVSDVPDVIAVGFKLAVSAVSPEGIESSLEFNCGGVIARTAPSPPTAPPTINNARFITLFSKAFLKSY